MAVVSIRVVRAGDRMRTVRALRPILSGMALSALRAAVEDGATVFEAELWLNDFAEVAETLRSLLAALEACGDEFEIAEDGEPIASELLLSMLEGSEAYRL